MSIANIGLHRAYKYRVDENRLDPKTKQFLLQSFGCARKVYNLYVDILYTALEARNFENGPIPRDIKYPEVTFFKGQEQYAYLNDVDSLALANAKISFHDAVKKYNTEYDHVSYTKRAVRRAESGTEALSFRGLKGMPKFHSKAHGDFSYKTNCQYARNKQGEIVPTVSLKGNMLHLPKLPADLPLVIHRPFPSNAVIGNVTMSMELDGSIYASIEYSYSCLMDTSLREAAIAKDQSILDNLTILGLDYSQKDFYVDSEGRKANYPHYYRKSEEKLAKLQRQLSRMQYDPEKHEGSNNYKRKLHEVQCLSRHIANQRKDFLQKQSTELVLTYDVIAVEDIDLRAMGSALSLGKNLHDNGFGMFRNMLSYKLEEKGSVLAKVPRFYASTKTCHCCGFKNPDVVLGVSEWDCPNCGAHHDRDYNAAINIRNEGKLALLDYFAQWLAEDEEKRQKAQNRTNARKNKKKKKKAA